MPLDKLPNKTYPALGLSLIDRAFKEAHAERCCPNDLAKLREYFGNHNDVKCIYCAEKTAKRWDHLYPVSKGGDTSLGNLVPACDSCDDSKQDKTLDEWSQSNAKYRPSATRLVAIKESIRQYRIKFPYDEQDFQSKMNDDTSKKYKRLRDALDIVRKVLIEDDIISK
ncbi:HNH endonuclease [Prosthecobacter sp.]|uniref:HNH endonuclease n=1 Tax=Prosthecobacter sp. TaxID=1965333 RepID=UPI001DC5EFCD|nr:HNH endonuclease [Prosthecobacter sp.]MCB1278444.1 HNH endonuclease [Prosthecobacter sp.]